MGPSRTRHWITPYALMCVALAAATVLLLALASCGSGRTAGRATSGPGSPTPRPTGINPTEAAALVPLAPPSVSAEGRSNGIRVAWSGTGQDDVHYLVHRKAPGSQEWAQLAAVAISGDNRGPYSYVDTSAERGKTYVYGVGAVNSAGRESAITESGPVTVPAS